MTNKELENLIWELEQLRDGANVHTINKAISYLRTYADTKSGRFSEEEMESRLNALVACCRIAIVSKDVKRLAWNMRPLW